MKYNEIFLKTTTFSISSDDICKN